MTSVIRLRDPADGASHKGQERLALFPGRALGEDEFDRIQVYFQSKLDRLLAGTRQGVVYGLDVETALDDPDDVGETFVVKPGLAVGADGQAMALGAPLRPAWADLAAGHDDGLWLLVITRETREVELGDDDEACRRTEIDPVRDLRIEQVLRAELIAPRSTTPLGV